MAPLVDITGLRYSYPEVATPALDDVTLALEGGLCVVAGPSGGGKSTLLRLLNGLVPHLYGGRIGGRAFVDGRDILRTPTRRLATSTGYVFQDAERQAVHTTVERDVAFGLENIGLPTRLMRERVDNMLHRLDLHTLRTRAIATLSGGERQRVAVAGALVLEPRLLVLDEPFAQLDTAAAQVLLELCLQLRDGGTTVVVSEHRLDDLLPCADSLLTVDGGRLGGPAEPAKLAAELHSAPQVVRLSQAMRWSPPLLSTDSLPVQASPAMPPQTATPGARTAWRLSAVAAGHGDLLHDVDAQAGAGEVVALMGRNGSGKTTLLRVIAGLVSPRSGSVWRAHGRVAYLPQNPAALLHRPTVADEIAWTLRGERSDDGAAVRALLQVLGVEAIAGCDPRDLSSGQRQRAAVAAILCGSPSIALLDEPTRGMDGTARDGLVAAIRSAAARGASVVVATHDSELAASVADRVLIIAEGQLSDRGSPATALSGQHDHATQLGRLFPSPGPVTVLGVAAALARGRAPVETAP